MGARTVDHYFDVTNDKIRKVEVFFDDAVGDIKMNYVIAISTHRVVVRVCLVFKCCLSATKV